MHFINDHGLALLLGWSLFSALVSGMPEPCAGDSRRYVWAYHSLHILAADLSHVWGSRISKP